MGFDKKDNTKQGITGEKLTEYFNKWLKKINYLLIKKDHIYSLVVDLL